MMANILSQHVSLPWKGTCATQSCSTAMDILHPAWFTLPHVCGTVQDATKRLDETVWIHLPTKRDASDREEWWGLVVYLNCWMDCHAILQKLQHDGEHKASTWPPNSPDSNLNECLLDVLELIRSKEAPLWIRLGSDPSRHGQKTLWDCPSSKWVDCPVAPIETYATIPKQHGSCSWFRSCKKNTCSV